MCNHCSVLPSRKENCHIFFFGGGGIFVGISKHMANTRSKNFAGICQIASLACLGDEPFRFRARGSEQIPNKFVELLQNKKLYQ